MNFQETLHSLPVGSKFDLLTTKSILLAVEFTDQPTFFNRLTVAFTTHPTYPYKCHSFNAYSPRVQAKKSRFRILQVLITRVGTLCNGTIFWAIWMNSRSWLHSVALFFDPICAILYFFTFVTCLIATEISRICLRRIWVLQARRPWDIPATWQDMGACRIDV